MNKLIAILFLAPAVLLVSPAALLVSPAAMASEGGVRLDTEPIKQTHVGSLQSGARTFANYCLNCHSASLMRWNRLMELGLTEAQIKDNLMFSGDKVGELMNVAMSRKDARQWFGAAPPALSVIARARDYRQVGRGGAEPLLGVLPAHGHVHQFAHLVAAEHEVVLDLRFGQAQFHQPVPAHERGAVAVEAVIGEGARAALQADDVGLVDGRRVQPDAALGGHRRRRYEQGRRRSNENRRGEQQYRQEAVAVGLQQLPDWGDIK